jgi:hypothetical protein
MDPDTDDAAWAQLENESQSYQEILANDPGYFEWIERNERERTNEIRSESIERF